MLDWYQHIRTNTVREDQSKVPVLFIMLKYNQLKSISAKGCRNMLDFIHILLIFSPVVERSLHFKMYRVLQQTMPSF
jgi:hypothetical protein